jgi:two-component system sensor histidine kinase BarA
MALQKGLRDSDHLTILLANLPANTSSDTYQKLANQLLNEQDLKAIAFYNGQNKLLVHAGTTSPDFTGGPLADGSDTDSFYHPDNLRFRSTAANVTDPNNATWALMEYDNNKLTLEKYRVIFINGLVFIIAIMLSMLFAVIANKQLNSALQKIRDGLKRIADGSFDEPIITRSTAAINQLANQLNNTAKLIQTNKLGAEQQIELATEDLTETLKTVEIQNIELDLARREAIDANKIKSQFLANTTHEIRTPLNGIIGFTNLLLKTTINRSQQDYLLTIKNSSEGLLAIINDILDLSRMEAGKLTLDPVETKLRQLVENTLDILAPSAYEKGLELALIIKPQTPETITADPLRLQQILTNLVSNAIKFTDQGDVGVTIELENRKESDLILKFTISDTGCGLTGQQQASLFNAFAQADTTSSRVHGGTGLGLTITKHLVEQMGGDIGLSSAPGEGSSFWFSIKTPGASRQGIEQTLCLEGLTIAAVEKNQLARKALVNLLTDGGAVVSGCGNLAELEHHRSQTDNSQDNFDAVVVALPAKPDTESIDAKQLGWISKLTNNPVIVLAPLGSPALTDQNVRQQTIMLAKPATRNRLYSTLVSLKEYNQDTLHNLANSDTETNSKPAILAVDDNPANLKLLAILLEDFGAEVHCAKSGSEALELCQQQAFDLIFMDIQMPGLDGIEVTQRIRASKSINTLTPIIALTAHALADEKHNLLMSGLNDHLSKPITEPLIGKMVNRWCNTNQQAPTTTETPVIPAGQPTSPIAKPVDIALCLQLANKRASLAEEMLTGLLNELDTNRGKINQHYRDKDYHRLQDSIHYLHGICCYTGVPNLRRATQSAESALKQQNWSELPAMLQKLDEELVNLQNWRDEHEVASLFAN